MVDPAKISNFNLTNDELEEVLLFWVCAAGKNGRTTARLLGHFLDDLKNETKDKITSPFEMLRKIEKREKKDPFIRLPDGSPATDWLKDKLKSHGIGNYTLRVRAFRELIDSNLDLRKCSADDLDAIIGIGPKTARAFIVHSRPKQRYAVIDTHILKYLKSLGHDVPTTTPNGKHYARLEKIFLDVCDALEVEPHKLDLAIWNHYSQRNKGDFDAVEWRTNA